MNGRLPHDQLAAADNAMETGAFTAGFLSGEFAKLLDTHELTAAHHAIFARLDSEYTPAQVQWIATVLIGREALRRTSPADVLWPSTIAARREGDVPASMPTPRTPKQVTSTWGRNAVEVYDEVPGDAQQIIALATGDSTEAVNEA